MSYYSVLEVTPTATDWLSPYAAVSNRLVEQYGGKYLARSSHHERLEGQVEQEPAVRVIIEWPSREAAISFMNDPEYRPHLEARTQGSISLHSLVEGE